MVPAGFAVIVFALNNKSSVTLDLWPFGLAVEMPVYLALALAFGAGALLGGAVAWAGQGRARSALREQAYEGEVARRELAAEKDKALRLERELEQERARAASPSPSPSGASVPTMQETLPPLAS